MLTNKFENVLLCNAVEVFVNINGLLPLKMDTFN